MLAKIVLQLFRLKSRDKCRVSVAPLALSNRIYGTPEVVRLATMMSIGYPLSLRQVEDLLFERGIGVCHEFVLFRRGRFGYWN